MKMNKIFFALMLTSFIFSISVRAAEFQAKQPFLITAAGQSQDVTMVKILAQKAGLNFTFNKLAQPDKLKDVATLVLVTGGSTKGLGAANIDKEQELSRVQALIKAAREAKINILTMHIGGRSRRGKLSDEFNKVTAENADCLIVVKKGDGEDKLFSNIAAQKKIPIFLIDKIAEAGDVMKKIFTEEK